MICYCLLKDAGMGIELVSEMINCLLFADDIVLIGKTEVELQSLLTIAGIFASMWNMKFNTSNSKVMVIGKRLDKGNEWKMGNSILIETNDYKYLGVYFSRSLSFSYHINCYLKENFERKFNYMIKLLWEHGTFNRTSFDDVMWNSVLRPSISHGCAVWMPSALSSKVCSKRGSIKQLN